MENFRYRRGENRRNAAGWIRLSKNWAASGINVEVQLRCEARVRISCGSVVRDAEGELMAAKKRRR